MSPTSRSLCQGYSCIFHGVSTESGFHLTPKMPRNSRITLNIFLSSLNLIPVALSTTHIQFTLKIYSISLSGRSLLNIPSYLSSLCLWTIALSLTFQLTSTYTCVHSVCLSDRRLPISGWFCSNSILWPEHVKMSSSLSAK